MDGQILDAVVTWVEAAEHGPGEGVLLDLTIDRPCPRCGGSTFCPRGCPMAICELDYTRTISGRMRPILESEYRRREDGEWEDVLVEGRHCNACTIYGQCLSCFSTDGRERRRARRKGSTYLVDTAPLYSVPGFELTDPIRISEAQVRKMVEARRDPQLHLLAAA